MADDNKKQPDSKPEAPAAPKTPKKSFLKRMKPNLRLSERFNFKAMKRKAIIGGVTLAVGAGAIGGAVGGKYLYDETERTVQFQVEALDSKRTIVRETCDEVKVEKHFSWKEPEVSVNRSACDQEVLGRIIRTPQGIFANDPSRIDLKNRNEVETIDANLKPGAWYEAVVKGWDFMGPPNIMSVERLPNNWREIREAREQGIELQAEFNNGAGQQRDAAKTIPAVTTPTTGGTSAQPSLEDIERQLEILKLQKQLEQLQNGSGQNNDQPAQRTGTTGPRPQQ
jgi:hypothetical protein